MTELDLKNLIGNLVYCLPLFISLWLLGNIVENEVISLVFSIITISSIVLILLLPLLDSLEEEEQEKISNEKINDVLFELWLEEELGEPIWRRENE